MTLHGMSAPPGAGYRRPTQAYALRKLLEHGPLSAGQIVHITGWAREDCERAVDELRDAGYVTSIKCMHVYGLTEEFQIAASTERPPRHPVADTQVLAHAIGEAVAA